MKLKALAILAAASTTQVANADVIDSVRIGVMAHNVQVIDPKNAHKEDGANINGEIRFHSPEVLRYIWSPHPYIMASVNTAGNTSFAAIGLEYDWEFVDGWHFEIGEGYAIHDGNLNIKGDTATERGIYQDENLLLGSRDLFRTNIALTKDFTETLSGQIMYEHLSHGQILGNGRNQGLDELGVRVVLKY